MDIAHTCSKDDEVNAETFVYWRNAMCVASNAQDVSHLLQAGDHKIAVFKPASVAAKK